MNDKRLLVLQERQRTYASIGTKDCMNKERDERNKIRCCRRKGPPEGTQVCRALGQELPAVDWFA